ncbi:hypothetical protein VP01_752g5 [Puccinia sorghi]|uniref:Uncharacterized protein n=1 Tax=Puccinia sorghi TaxID=27349 RepID=A0A0L6UE77_9BASI|nr:hypothetical protein VP01_752g5 [Puccinia sorghi]
MTYWPALYTDLTQFQNFQASKLEEAGMKGAHARALKANFKQFEQNLKSYH